MNTSQENLTSDDIRDLLNAERNRVATRAVAAGPGGDPSDPMGLRIRVQPKPFKLGRQEDSEALDKALEAVQFDAEKDARRRAQNEVIEQALRAQQASDLKGILNSAGPFSLPSASSKSDLNIDRVRRQLEELERAFASAKPQAAEWPTPIATTKPPRVAKVSPLSPSRPPETFGPGKRRILLPDE